MKILVILKRTPDTETKILIKSDGAAIDESNIKFIINPYDEHAIEEALILKQKIPNCEVIVASVGPDSTRELIVKGLAMGADRGLLIKDDGLERADSLVIAKILRAMVKSESPDVILCGKQAIDDDNMHVGLMLAELLNWPHINVVNKLSIENAKVSAEREIEGGEIELYTATLPIVIGANKALNTPRYASVPGIMKAKKKPLDLKNITDYGLNLSELRDEIKTVTRKFTYPPEKPPGKLFQGEDVQVMVSKVVNLLHDEAKVI